MDAVRLPICSSSHHWADDVSNCCDSGIFSAFSALELCILSF